MLSFPSVPGLALIVLVWAGAWMVSRFLPECLEIRVRSSMRGDFIQSLVPALSPPWFWLFFFFFPSPEVVRTLLSEVSGDLLWLLQCFFHQFSWKSRGEGAVQNLCLLQTTTAGLLNLISSFWGWRCSSEYSPKTNLIFLWNRVTTLGEPYSQWAGIPRFTLRVSWLTHSFQRALVLE